jgi:hypothetical protein
MAGLVPEEAIKYHWFEMPDPGKPVQVDAEVMSRRLPFQKVAVACQLKGGRLVLLLVQTEQITGCVPMLLTPRGMSSGKAFGYVVQDGEVRVWHHDRSPFDPKTSGAAGYAPLIAAFLLSLDTGPVAAYQPAMRPNHAKRVRQGRPPQYDWETIIIEPPQPKADPQGGTHASPRWHERRGHWRTTRSGKRCWVRNCEVGDKAKGAVFHDYVINPAG